MTTIARVKLSASTDGRGIKIATTGTPGTTVHTAHATSLDEVWLWATNTDTTDRKLTLEWGGVAAPDDDREMTIAAEGGPILICPGWILTNSLLVKLFCASANLVIIDGYVNRIT